MEERRINKLHGCLIEDNRVPELIQKMGSGGGLQPITLTGKQDESGQITFDNLTEEIFDKLKTREYCILLDLIINDGTEEGVQINASTFVTLVQEVSDFTIMFCSPISDEQSIVFMSSGSGEEQQFTGILTSFGFFVNPTGEIYSVDTIKYLAKEQLSDLDTVSYNSAWCLVNQSGVGAGDWQGNILNGFSYFDETARIYIENQYRLNALSLQVVFTINNVKYTTICTKDTISSFIIINDDLSTTYVTCKCAVDNGLAFDFKAIKDKTDITDTIKQGLTNIELYAL